MIFTLSLPPPPVFSSFFSWVFVILYFRKLQPRLGDTTVLTFYQDVPYYNFHFLYINCQKNYLINRVDQLFRGTSTTMYLQKQTYVIHPAHQPCLSKNPSTDSNDSSDNSSHSIQQRIDTFLRTTYPKQKYLPLVFSILHPHTLFDAHLFFHDFKNIHVADFISFLINPFGKIDSTDHKFVRVVKYLQSKHIVLPKVAVKNPVAVKYLCA